MLYQRFANEATQAICYDGQDIFSSAHPVDPNRPELGTFSNVFTTASGNARPLSIDNFWYVAEQMMAIPSESGRPMGIFPNLLVVPPQLRQIATTIAKAALVAPQTFAGATQVGSQSNMLAGEIEVLVIPEFATISPTNWFALDTTKPVKPFIVQKRRAPRTVARVDAALDNLFNKREYQWGVDARGAAGVSFWQFAAKGGA
jgi:phage major head subunit gpT-like protein